MAGQEIVILTRTFDFHTFPAPTGFTLRLLDAAFDRGECTFAVPIHRQGCLCH